LSDCAADGGLAGVAATAPPTLLLVAPVPVDGAGDDGVADDGDEGDELVSSVLEHPATTNSTTDAASSNAIEGFVFMEHACNGPIALWQPQAYNL
jgi:hypothetical protein